MKQIASCPLCRADDANLIWHNDLLRVVHVPDGGYPGYTRVIWNQHVTEMTDLEPALRNRFMDAVWAVESVMRSKLAPQKVNLAQFGNQVPHLHWHIIPRWPNDTHFPDAVWAAPKHRSAEQNLTWQAFCEQQEMLLPGYHQTLQRKLDETQR